MLNYSLKIGELFSLRDRMWIHNKAIKETVLLQWRQELKPWLGSKKIETVIHARLGIFERVGIF